jgi:hypothetical protein
VPSFVHALLNFPCLRSVPSAAKYNFAEDCRAGSFCCILLCGTSYIRTIILSSRQTGKSGSLEARLTPGHLVLGPALFRILCLANCIQSEPLLIFNRRYYSPIQTIVSSQLRKMHGERQHEWVFPRRLRDGRNLQRPSHASLLGGILVVPSTRNTAVTLFRVRLWQRSSNVPRCLPFPLSEVGIHMMLQAKV